MKLFYFALAFILILLSCDVPAIFSLKVSDRTNVSVTIYADNRYFKRLSTDENKKIVLKLPANQNKIINDTMFIYGFGCSWDDKSLMEFSNSIDSIQIVGSKTFLNLTNQIDIYNYLKKNRHGKKRLTISVE